MINFSLFAVNLIAIAFSFDEFIDFRFKENDDIRELNSPCVTTINTVGYCKRAHDCPKGRFQLTREDICHYEVKHPVVCCEIDAPPPVTTQRIIEKIITPRIPTNLTGFTFLKPNIPHDQYIEEQMNPKGTQTSTNKVLETSLSERIYSDIRGSERIPDKECVKYLEKRYPKKNSTAEAQIFFVGGSRSMPGQNPQIAALGWKSFNDDIEWKCGGSLISENFVMTAAHCAYDRGQPVQVIRVGSLHLLNAGDSGQNFNVTEIIVHPDYRNRSLYHDIALLKISPNAKIDSDVAPGCLWTGNDIPVTKLIGMGYGTDRFAGKRRNELYEGDLTVVPNEECRNFLRPTSELPNGIVDTQLCATDPEGKVDTCQGDSGGPLIFRTTSGNQHVVGITSFGDSCAGSTPGVYTRVSSYIDWIESIVWPG